MGLLDWFKNRQSQFDPDSPSDELTLRAIDKAVALTNPRLKLVRGYQERLAPAVEVLGQLRGRRGEGIVDERAEVVGGEGRVALHVDADEGAVVLDDGERPDGGAEDAVLHGVS